MSLNKMGGSAIGILPMSGGAVSHKSGQPVAGEMVIAIFVNWVTVMTRKNKSATTETTEYLASLHLSLVVFFPVARRGTRPFAIISTRHG